MVETRGGVTEVNHMLTEWVQAAAMSEIGAIAPADKPAFIEARLASLPDEALIEECRVWSVPAREIDAFSRAEARRVWAFRNRLSVDGQAAFDARPAGLRLQLAELYFEVMSSELAPIDRSLVAPVDRLTLRAEADAQAARAAAGSVD